MAALMGSVAPTPLLGSCGDACANACLLAQEARSADGGASLLLVVGLMLFLAVDAIIACAAIYGAGRLSADHHHQPNPNPIPKPTLAQSS